MPSSIKGGFLRDDTTGALVISGGNPATPVSGVAGNTIMCLGDSISSNGWQAPGGATSGRAITGQAYLMWAMLLSKGRLTIFNSPDSASRSPSAATTGFTTQDMITTHLSTVLAAKPDFCIVLGGTNDINNGIGFTTAAANLRAMYDALLGAGIIPVVASIPPRNTAPRTAHAYRNWAAKYAALNGLPYVDFFEALVNPNSAGGFFGSGLHAGDGLHPSSAGAKIMGQALWNALEPYVSSTRNALPHVNAKSSGGNDNDQLRNTTNNSLFYTDTNADGIPDGWTIVTGTGTPSLVAAGTASLGQQFKLVNATGTYEARAAALGTFADGDRCVFLAELDAQVEAAAGTWSLYLQDNAGAQQMAGAQTIDKDVPGLSVWAQEFTWRGGAQTSARVLFGVTGVGAIMTLARCGIVNLASFSVSTML